MESLERERVILVDFRLANYKSSISISKLLGFNDH